MPQSCLGIFATNAPDAPHWSPNSCFVVFRSVWVHLGPSHYCMKLGAKWAKLVQLMQQFVPQSRISIFRNERTQSNPYDPKLTFWHVSCFGAFHSVWVRLESFFYCRKLGAKWAKLVQLMQKFVLESCIGIFATNAPDPNHWTPNSFFVAFRSVWVHLAPFGYCMKLGAKWAELVHLMQKFVPRCCVRNFRNEHTRSNP